jgi:hypothetical protein
MNNSNMLISSQAWQNVCIAKNCTIFRFFGPSDGLYSKNTTISMEGNDINSLQQLDPRLSLISFAGTYSNTFTFIHVAIAIDVACRCFVVFSGGLLGNGVWALVGWSFFNFGLECC